jgi:hypothetical protein
MSGNLAAGSDTGTDDSGKSHAVEKVMDNRQGADLMNLQFRVSLPRAHLMDAAVELGVHGQSSASVTVGAGGAAWRNSCHASRRRG